MTKGSRLKKHRKSSCIIGALVKNTTYSPLAHSTTYEEILGIADELQRSDLMMNLIRYSDFSRSDTTLSDRLRKEQVLDGIIVTSCSDLSDSISDLIRASAPSVIWCNSDIWEDYDCIRLDEQQGGFSLAEYAYSIGYRKFIFVYRPEITHFSHQERITGVRQFVNGSNANLKLMRLRNRAASGDFGAILDQADKETAIIAGSTRISEDLLYYLAGNTWRVGQDFGLASCGSKRDFIDALPALTRMDSRRCELGMHAARLMIDKLECKGNPQHSRVIQLELIPGSTLPPV